MTRTFFAAACAGVIALAANSSADVVLAHDFSGTEVPNLSGFQNGRDQAGGGDQVTANVAVEDGVLKLPTDVADDQWYFTRVMSSYELPDRDTNWTLTVVFEYNETAPENCSFGVTWHDYGAQSALPNQSIRMGDGIDGPGWKAIVGRTEAWEAALVEDFAVAPQIGEELTLVITKTGPSTVDITLDGETGGSMLDITGADFSGLAGGNGMPEEFGYLSVYNAAFGDAPYSQVYVDSIALMDTDENVLFADDFSVDGLDTDKWLSNPPGTPIDVAFWPEAMPNRPSVRGDQLSLIGQAPWDLNYSRAPLNMAIRPENPTVKASFDLFNLAQTGATERHFGIKIRNNGDEATSIVAALDPIGNTVRVGENDGPLSVGAAESTTYEMNEGEVVWVTVEANGPSVTVSVGPDENTVSASVTKNDFSGARLDPGSILFYVSGLDEIRVNEFMVEDPDFTSVMDWQMF